MVTTGSAQPDIVLPGHAEIDTWLPDSGLPMTDLWLELHGDFRDIPMPPGPKGPDGAPGRPRATFVKMGAIANEAARPAVLGPGARGWWWHRLDTNGMDVWCGDHWKHSPGAVGPTGPVARPNTLTPLPVLRDERYTMAAVRVRGRRPDNQTIEYTVPAGERGPRGPDGNVFGTAITQAPDYDDTYGQVDGSMFAYRRETRRFRSLARPANGYGPFHFGSDVFTGPTEFRNFTDAIYDQRTNIVATVEMPALPFPWRPMVNGMIRTSQAPTGGFLAPVLKNIVVTVRLNQADGDKVATGENYIATETFDTVWRGVDTQFNPFFGDRNASLRPGQLTKYGSVAAYESCVLLVQIEVVPNKAQYAWITPGAFLTVWALPLMQNSGVANESPAQLVDMGRY